MLDMIAPSERHSIALADLRHCRMTPIFFDTFFNLEKYLDHEQRDPFASQRDLDEDGNEVIYPIFDLFCMGTVHTYSQFFILYMLMCSQQLISGSFNFFLSMHAGFLSGSAFAHTGELCIYLLSVV